MTSIPLSSYELDLSHQADALEFAASKPLNREFAALDLSKYERIIITGMGSSDSVSIPFEYALLRQGLPVWRIQTSRLLDTPEVIAGRTLLWITSQSGRSGEAIALLSKIPSRQNVTVVAIKNDAESPLCAERRAVSLPAFQQWGGSIRQLQELFKLSCLVPQSGSIFQRRLRCSCDGRHHGYGTEPPIEQRHFTR